MRHFVLTFAVTIWACHLPTTTFAQAAPPNVPPIAAIVGSSPQTRKLVCTDSDALSYLKNKLREISGSPNLELQDVTSVDSRTCRATVVEGGRRSPGKFKLERISGYERITWDNDAGGRSMSWPTGVRFNEPPADPMEGIRKSAEKNPSEMVGCGVQGPKQVYTTRDVCYAVMKLSQEMYNPAKPYAGYHLLRVCGSLPRSTCLAMIAELRKLHSKENSKSTIALTEECASDLQSNSSASGEEKARYMNTCQDLIGSFLR